MSTGESRADELCEVAKSLCALYLEIKRANDDVQMLPYLRQALTLIEVFNRISAPLEELESADSNEIRAAWEMVNDLVENATWDVEKTTWKGEPLHNNYTWDYVDDGVEITSYVGLDAHVTVPSFFEGMPVVRIGRDAFESLPLETVILPDSVQTIGACAFLGCDKLRRVSLPGSLDHIEVSAFRNTENLVAIDFPRGLRIIDKCAFMGSGLRFAIIPDSVILVGDNAFTGCDSSFIAIEDQMNTLVSPSAFYTWEDFRKANPWLYLDE